MDCRYRRTARACIVCEKNILCNATTFDLPHESLDQRIAAISNGHLYDLERLSRNATTLSNYASRIRTSLMEDLLSQTQHH